LGVATTIVQVFVWSFTPNGGPARDPAGWTLLSPRHFTQLPRRRWRASPAMFAENPRSHSLDNYTNRQSAAYSYARREQPATDSTRRPAAQDRRPGGRSAFSFGGQLQWVELANRVLPSGSRNRSS
jgi:hypothetical protein